MTRPDEVEARTPASSVRSVSDAGLTDREREILSLLAQGQMNAQVAQDLGISEATVQAHVDSAKRRLGAVTRAQAVALMARDLTMATEPESATLLTHAFEARGPALAICDEDGVIRAWNETAVDAFGFTTDDAVGRTLDEVLRPLWAGGPQAVRTALAATTAWEGAVLLTAKDGTRLMRRGQAASEPSPDGPQPTIYSFLPLRTAAEAQAVVPDVLSSERLYLHQLVRNAQGRVTDTVLLYVGVETRLQEPLAAEHVGTLGSVAFPEFRESALFRIIEKVGESGEPVDFHEVRLQPPWADQPLIMEGRAVPFGEDTVAVRARDVTAERRALQALENAQARVRGALAAAPVAVVQTDRDLVVKWVGGSIGLSAKDPERLLGRRLPIGMDERDVAAFHRAAQYVLQTGAEDRIEVHMVAPEAPSYLEVLISPCRDLDGHIAGLLFASLDITERVELQATLDSLLDPHVVLDAVRDEGGQIVDFRARRVNLAATQYLRMAREELEGRVLLELFPEHRSSGMLDLCASAIDAERPIVLNDFPYSHEQLVGGQRRYDIRGVPMDDALSLTWRDVTDR